MKPEYDPPRCRVMCPDLAIARCVLRLGHKGKFHRSYTRVWPVAKNGSER